MRFLRGAAAFAVLLGLAISCTISPARAEDDLAKMARFVSETGFKSQHPAPKVWVLAVPVDGAPSPRTVLIGTGNGIVVVGTVAAEKAELRLTQEVLMKLIKANHQYDRVKIAIDDDGDLAVRADLTVRLLDGAELKDVAQQVARVGESLRRELLEK